MTHALLATGLLRSFGALGLLAAAAMLAILFTVILTTLRRAEVFPAGANLVLSICASLLAVVGIMRRFGHAEEITSSSGSSWLDFILLPYTAMAIAILLILVLLFFRKVLSGGEKASRRPKREIRREFAEHTADGDGQGEWNRKV